MFECNNVLRNWKNLRLATANDLTKLIANVFTYVQVRLLLSRQNPAIKKKCKTLRNLLNLLAILSCALPICSEEFTQPL